MQVSIIKIGGKPLQDAHTCSLLATDIQQEAVSHHSCAVVHGGGTHISALSQQWGITPQFKDGVRITSEKEMKLVDMALGEVNAHIVRLFCAKGVFAVGVAGYDSSTIHAEVITGAERTGKALSCNPSLLQLLLKNGYTPIINPASSDVHGKGLNINADDVAQRIAHELHAHVLLYLTDTAGVLDKEGNVIRSISRQNATQLIADGTVSQGMIAKLQSIFATQTMQQMSVVIGQYEKKGDLRLLLQHKKGTTLHD